MIKLYTSIALLIFAQITVAAPKNSNVLDINKSLKKLETQYNRSIGLYAFDENTNKVILFNANKRYPFQSTFKLLAVAALLYQHQETPVLDDKVTVKPSDIVPWGPVSHQYVNKAISYKALCEAAIAYSDNTAINLIIHKLGGVENINNFAHRLGNNTFNLKHMEINLNSELGNKDDTSTPLAMGKMLKALLKSDSLATENKRLLTKWLSSNTTGYDRIRAGVPLGWSVADKTGSGEYGIANDLGIAWSPGCKPITLSIYTAGAEKPLRPNSELVAKITRLTLNTFAKHHDCYQLTDILKIFKQKG